MNCWFGFTLEVALASRKSGWIKSILQTFLIFLVLSVILDIWRSPRQPVVESEQMWVTSAGHVVQLQKLGNERATLIYFWGSWCGICRYTSPAVNKLSEKGVPVVGVALQSGTMPEVQRYLQQHQWSFETINDETGDLSREWEIKAAPTIAIIKNGKIRHSTSGISSYWGLYLRWKWIDWLY